MCHRDQTMLQTLETTGLPREELNKTKITELSVIAVKRQHLLDTTPKSTPRVQQKLSLCLYPGRMIQPGCTKVTGLSNELLEHETKFDIRVFDILNGFLNILTKPVCLIAQNGLCFDFPILKAQLNKLNVNFSEDLMCADCYYAFYDILEEKKMQDGKNCQQVTVVVQNELNKNQSTVDYSTVNANTSREVEQKITNFNEGLEEGVSLQSRNEVTPKKSVCNIEAVTPRKSKMTCNRVSHNKISKACRRFPWNEGPKPVESYKMKDIYERVLGEPSLEAHRAENDCLMALKCSVVKAKDFVKWVDENHVPFTEVKPMKIGVKLGY